MQQAVVVQEVSATPDEWFPLTPEQEFMESVKEVARGYIGSDMLNDADLVSCDPVLQLARKLAEQDGNLRLF